MLLGQFLLVGYTELTPLNAPTLGTPATATDALRTLDSSGATGSIFSQLKFSGDAGQCLSGTATWLAFQGYDTDLDLYAGITPGAFVQTFLDDEDQATFQGTLKALFPVTQAATVANAGTLTPTAGYKEIDIALTCSNDPSAITLAEAGAIANAVIRVTNVAANTCTVAYAASNFEHKGGTGTSLTLETGDSFIAQFQTDRWRVLVNNSSTQYFSYLQVPTKTLDPVVGDPDSTTFTTASTNLYGQRFIATATGTYAHSGVVSTGENWVIESQTATAVAVTVNASDTYWLNGVSCTASVGLTSDSSVDAFVACQYQAANTVTCRGTSFTCTP